MKRSPLRRGKPLARAGKLRAISQRRKQKQQVEAALRRIAGADFRRAVMTKRCAVCGLREWEAYEATGHGHEAHHALPQQALRRRGLEAHLWDKRNAVPLCAEPCHRRVTSTKRPLFWEELPAAAIDFADALGLIPVLERLYPTKEDTRNEENPDAL